MIRTHLIKALYDNLLGPGSGHDECVEEPFLKYEMGVLNSSHSLYQDGLKADPVIDAEMNPDPAEMGEEAACLSDTENTHESEVLRREVDGELNFKTGACSLGLSFVLQGDSPRFRICLTWARYLRQGDAASRPRLFRRHPNFYVTGWLGPDTDPRPRKLGVTDGDNRVTSEGAVLHVLSKRMEGSDRWVVRIFLENRTEYDVSRIQTERERIFQPQIRVRVRDAGLADLDAGTAAACTGRDHGYGSDDLLYRGSRTKARGFLCAAVWGEVDPESGGGEDGGDGIISGMSWPDAAAVPAGVRSEFFHPDARTEYLPMYAVLQPDLPECGFDASKLAQTWDPDEIDGCLRPITAGYSGWIKEQGVKLDRLAAEEGGSIGPQLKRVGEANLRRCEEACRRIGSGIEFLKKDERARIAFCFMNTVMNDKYGDERGGHTLSWRRFQMAFMLQCIRGIAGRPKTERDIADILWFPTGGGKTEAYLGLVVFCMAYRRLAPSAAACDGDGRRPETDGGVAAISRYTLRLLTVQQFQRALGAVVSADIRRVENWVPGAVRREPGRIEDPDLAERLQNDSMWGRQRFSIGLWIGGTVTPNEFPSRIIRGRRLPNCEGVLLPEGGTRRRWGDAGGGKRLREEDTGDPAQVQTCPVCGNTLCLPKGSERPGASRCLTWVVSSPRSREELERIPKGEYEQKSQVTLEKAPGFRHMGDSGGRHYYRMTMEITPAEKRMSLTRKRVDRWWESFVRPHLDPGSGNPLESTRPSMPGYFFLRAPNTGQAYDFAIFCTNPDCRLNGTDWYERQEGVRRTQIPEPFRIGAVSCGSTSVPISAFTYDEQVYYRCPSFVIATVDKFANLPFEPRCAALFGNVDAVHPVYGGYGRREAYTGQVRARGGGARGRVDDELHSVAGFLPPSLIVQDELHLIEGQLGSMVGAYEMAVDALSDHCGMKPKYVASSATIKEAESQVGTVFRRRAATFPPPGIDAKDNHFSEIAEDAGCAKELPGRVYLGMATGKSNVILPIKAQSVIMSEIFRMRSNPRNYGSEEEEAADDDGICGNAPEDADPYWTFVSYFTDLRLLARFAGYYEEDIVENVRRWSRERVFSPGERAAGRPLRPGFRVYQVRSDKKMVIAGVSVYCTNAVGGIMAALYRDGSPVGPLVHMSGLQECRTGENEFEIPKNRRITVGAGDAVWIGLVNYDERSEFETVSADQSHFEGPSGVVPDTFPGTVSGMRECRTDGVRLSINSQGRRLDMKNSIRMSSATRPEELPGYLERLEKRYEIDSLQTSPVFGTGVDIDRLGVIEIMNQPKTSSGYIQASGRVGRRSPGLVISWLRAGRTRDLNHYENFVGYHRMLHRFVEPVTAAPFSRGVMELCLGPVLVAVLRNARAVLPARVNRRWVGQEGPARMAGHAGDPEVGAIRGALLKIAAACPISRLRRMKQARFGRMFEEAVRRWRDVAEYLRGDGPGSFVYAERMPGAAPEKNVVLGTQNHAESGLDYVYGNVPNSMRQVEPAAVFCGSEEEEDQVRIRPSQFVTRYGPGEIVTGPRSTWVIPSVGEMVEGLSGRKNFEEPDASGRGGLDRYEVGDSRMRRILYRFNQGTEEGKLKLFSLPTNPSLQAGDSEPVFRCGRFPRWAVCHSRAHPARRFLTGMPPPGTGEGAAGEGAVRCPGCWHLRPEGEGRTTEFHSVRYVLACGMGHMGDLDWAGEVHRSSGQDCGGDVFEWIPSDGNEDVEIRCAGRWGADGSFIPSVCGAKTSYAELKDRSRRGRLECGARFVEGGGGGDSDGGDPEGCPPVGGMSRARLISRAQMSARMPVVTTTLEVGGRRGELFESYEPLAESAAAFIDEHPEVGRQEFVDGFLQRNRGRCGGITGRLIRQTRQASDAEFDRLIEEIRRDQVPRGGGGGRRWISERESLEEELSRMEGRAGEGRGGGPEDGGDPGGEARPPARFASMAGLHFEAVPFEDVRVTHVQSGYTREVPPPSRREGGGVRDDGGRTGRIVYGSQRHTDGEGRVWYLANQLRGEGVFIHLDPERHPDAMEVFGGGDGHSLRTWSGIWADAGAKNVASPGEGPEGGGEPEQEVDVQGSDEMHANPLFVWWHSLAHELVNQISVDSGFMGVALGERVYCVKRSGGAFSAGLFIYAAVPGTDGTLGGLTSLVDPKIFKPIIDRTLRKIRGCSNDPVCSERRINGDRRNGAACHVCLMNSETSCAYRNRFLDRNLVAEALDARSAEGEGPGRAPGGA